MLKIMEWKKILINFSPSYGFFSQESGSKQLNITFFLNPNYDNNNCPMGHFLGSIQYACGLRSCTHNIYLVKAQVRGCFYVQYEKNIKMLTFYLHSFMIQQICIHYTSVVNSDKYFKNYVANLFQKQHGVQEQTYETHYKRKYKRNSFIHLLDTKQP